MYCVLILHVGYLICISLYGDLANHLINTRCRDI